MPQPSWGPAAHPASWPAVLVLAGGLLGAALGAVWWWVWTPSEGTVLKETWLMSGDTQRAQFDGTGWFVVVGLAGGLLFGLVAAVLGGRRPLGTLLGLVLGSVLASRVMFWVGHALGPADPRPLATGAKDWATFPSDLRVGDLAHVAWWDVLPNAAFGAVPAGALVALSAWFLLVLPPARAR